MLMAKICIYQHKSRRIRHWYLVVPISLPVLQHDFLFNCTSTELSLLMPRQQFHIAFSLHVAMAGNARRPGGAVRGDRAGPSRGPSEEAGRQQRAGRRQHWHHRHLCWTWSWVGVPGDVGCRSVCCGGAEVSQCQPRAGPRLTWKITGIDQKQLCCHTLHRQLPSSVCAQPFGLIPLPTNT